MKRGDIYLVDLDPALDSEADKRRPAVIVSNDGANSTAAALVRGAVTVVPVTSNMSRVYPFQVELTATECGLRRDCKAQAEQVRTVSVQRLVARIGSVPLTTMNQLDEALRLHLAL